MVASYRPDLYLGCAFNADPNSTDTPVWTDLTARLRHADGVKRGRQYELDQNQSGQPTMTLWDPDEYLNPGNPSSPYSPNVVPYRQILMRAVWPNPCTGNLLNLGGVPTSIDPTFENYGTGGSPAWVLPVGGVSPAVVAANPWQGFQSLQWTTAASSTQQGIALNVPCIPGRQYTTSTYVRQTAANSQQITVDATVPVQDFFSRTASNGWGTADTGQTWVVDGPAAQFSVSGGTGAHAVSTVGTMYRSRLTGPTFADTNLVFVAYVPTAPAGSYIRTEAIIRWVDASNYYTLRVHRQTDTSITLQIVKLSGGVETVLASVTSVVVNNPAISLHIRFQAVGTTLQARIWRDDAPAEPTTWEISATDATIATGTVGIATLAPGGNTNTLPFSAFYGAVTVTGTAPGTSTTTTGAYTRLAVTFTATQPTHRVIVATAGAVAVSTVNVDALQHEQAASASAFTSTGSVIYPVLRDYVERWPSSWEPNSAGFAGLAEITCVDALAVLQGVDLHTELRRQQIAKTPDLWWPLADGSNANAWAEVSGNNAPPLTRIDMAGSSSSSNPPSFASGTATNIPGDPGGTGVTVGYSAPASGQPITYLQTGGGQSAPINVDATSTPSAVTLACWVAWTGAFPADQGIFAELMDPYQMSAFYLTWNSSGIAAQAASIPYVGASANTAGSGTVNVSAKADGKPHLFVATLTTTSGGVQVKLYIDGSLAASGPSVGPSGYTMRNPFTRILIGGAFNPQTGLTFQGLPNGVYSHIGVWKHELSAQDVTDLWNAGQGYPGETSGARVARYLGYAYVGPTSVDTGQSTMGPSSVTDTTSALAAIQQATLSENGNFWVDPSGQATFRARTARYLTTTSKVTFGERTDLGEIPYLGDIKFNFDPTYIYNDIEVTRTGGVVARAPDAASQRRFFKRSYQRTIDVASDLETIDAANWILNTHKAPSQRVERITLDPVGYPAAWPVVLGLEIGTRVTVKRRAKAANGGAGLTMSADYFVESIEHSGIDMEAGTWTTTLLLSPAIGYQVWILGDSTYGVLGTSTTLGY